jgi:hypothetical protein
MPSFLKFFVWILAIQLASSNSVRRITEQYKQLVIQIPGYSPTESDDYVSVAIKAEPGYISMFYMVAQNNRIFRKVSTDI